ncbi:hypothetical protein BIFCAT_01268 [Bifidobacterium catenulatum DSM 16992 = JCM 1194 = LMG 11043]|uniref:Uncharacterized protein n=1 Tax=Bifidobacterium catenulatum DSM 16992 = JCM 1194 = LMG 11043 TaxID=566552 RepID=B6XVY5_9BIFI|nr:hypothetical protein BIFCAT_01268 [Bifidobacterium catenulatum DSM 16992 = JCM 1194 = LMG 11043]
MPRLNEARWHRPGQRNHTRDGRTEPWHSPFDYGDGAFQASVMLCLDD